MKNKKLLIFIVLSLIFLLVISISELIDYLELRQLRQEWSEELSLIKDDLIYSHRHDRYVFVASIQSFDRVSIHWTVGIREPVFDKKYDKYNFITDSGRFRPAETKVYKVETNRFTPSRKPEIKKYTSYEEFTKKYGVGWPYLRSRGSTAHMYIWDNEYVFLSYSEFGRGELYNLKTKEPIYELNKQTHYYDTEVKNAINFDQEDLLQLFMTEDGALVSVYKKYNKLYVRLLN